MRYGQLPTRFSLFVALSIGLGLTVCSVVRQPEMARQRANVITAEWSEIPDLEPPPSICIFEVQHPVVTLSEMPWHWVVLPTISLELPSRTSRCGVNLEAIRRVP
jgi:hypothetical protein